VAAKKNDAMEPIKQAASCLPATQIGTSCNQTSFKVNKKAFLYIGVQGGRYKAMFKLKESRGQAIELAKKEPDCYEVGSTAYVTVRFTDDKPMPTKLWKKWLDESYQLSAGKAVPKKTAKKVTRKSQAKKTTTKKKTSVKKKAVKKKTVKKKTKKKSG